MATFDYKALDGHVYTVDAALLEWLVVVAPAIIARTGGSAWELAWDGTARRSNPDTASDTSPNDFTFVSQTGVAQSTVITSAAITIAGINAAAPVSVTGGTWSKNGGAYTAAAGTVVVTDTITVRHTSAAALNTQTQTLLTVGDKSAAFTSTTVSSPGRVGLIHRISFDTFTADVRNIEPAQWPVSRTNDPDGGALRHRAQSIYSPTASILAKDHFRVRSDIVPPPGNGVRCASFHIWDDVSYDTGGFQDPRNKPRVDIQMSQVGQALSLAYRTTYWLGLAIYLPSTYEEENQSSENEILFQCHNPNDVNNFEMHIRGVAGAGAQWRCQLNRHNETSATVSLPNVKSFTTPVAPAHIGAWTYHVWQLNIDNRLSGGSPIFKWWVNEARIANDTSTAYGGDAGGFANWFPAINLYKPNYRGHVTGSYAGNKSGEIWLAFDALRLGSAASDYASVHPTQAALPA